ncbi:MAG: protein translocase subunit SecF [Candidatus Marinimicrobia bacterium]|jgi:preprotein translocase subunit SecF|nr:protein translocase subunit SecF [Candidatus Neomarinimicrobiota bacterium]MDP7122295.1 protein translocase subunit SecF [Candidatus Neomarinimicrobiota bacterium]MDP7483163.1 protein translocase subunit SecF [Candidatus Neomarinimicrobiota bacterium]MDP7715945.1 protein translocase subunit SecF [Candidatus Neomarinimicrobiota bacterium]HJM85677.1 protein translocase subunit SecF [Candidatus Neomarinimicrobiota bacterium]|tara:strand:+ start:1031 stop:1930 length:900 start_codon:yes stop_codon:yes gene_type:complete
MRFLKETNIDFLSMRRFGFVISGSFILAGIVSLLLQGGPLLSIDFTGGTLAQIRFEEAPDIAKVRSALEALDVGIGEVQTFGTPNEILIRLQLSQNAENLTTELKAALQAQFPGQSIDFRRVETVGPKIGSELKGKAFFAVFSAIIGILIYISIRFELKFAIGAIAALIHDVLITLGVFSILNYEISLAIIAAFLTIVGYSLNDTIVVFDRVRENMKLLKNIDQETIFNKSINESLSRTIITSLTTFAVVFILYIAGGEVIRYFAFAMIVGVIVGTYSSIYVASPVVFLWQQRMTPQSK